MRRSLFENEELPQTWFHRITSTIYRKPAAIAVVQTLALLCELGLLSCYFAEPVTAYTTTRLPFAFDVSPTIFWCEVAFSFPLVLQFIVWALTSPDIKIVLQQGWGTLGDLVTIFYLCGQGIVALSIGRPVTLYTPLFLRVFAVKSGIRDVLQKIHWFSTYQVDLVDHVLGMIAMILTAAGVFFSLEMFFSPQSQLNFFDAFYGTVIIFSTIGYGDVVPTNPYSRMATIAIIIVALIRFGPFFQYLSDYVAKSAENRSYRRKRGGLRHVIVAGDVNATDVRLMLNEFFASGSRYTPVHVVILSTSTFSKQVEMAIAQVKMGGTMADQVTLMVGDPINAVDLERCDALHASAIFLLSHDKTKTTAESDEITILRARSVRLYDPLLPQFVEVHRLGHNGYLLQPIGFEMFRSTYRGREIDAASLMNALGMKPNNLSFQGVPVELRTTPAAIPAPTEADSNAKRKQHHKPVVIEKTQLRLTLLGLGVVLPGSITLLVSLMSSYDSNVSATELQAHWVSAVDWSMGQEFYSFPCPLGLVGRTFLQSAALLRPLAITVICMVDVDDNIKLNPSAHTSDGGLLTMTAEDRFVAIVADADAITAGLASVAEMTQADIDRKVGRYSSDPFDRHVHLTRFVPTNRHEQKRRRQPMGEAMAGILASGGGDDDLSSDTKDASNVDSPWMRLVVNNVGEHGIKDHYLLIDLRGAQSASDTLSIDERNRASADLATIVKAIKVQNKAVTIVILGRHLNTPSLLSAFREYDATGIYRVEGSGLETDDLLRCGLHSVRGVLIFSTAPSGVSSQMEDTHALLVTAAVNDIVAKAHPSPHDVHIVTDTHSLDALELLPPQFSEDDMTRKAKDNFFFQPCFFCGRSISDAMLDQTLYQAFFSKDAVRVIQALTSTPGVIQMMSVPTQCRTVMDVIEHCFGLGSILIALKRWIHDAKNVDLDRRRFVIINPDATLPIVDGDEFYCLAVVY